MNFQEQDAVQNFENSYARYTQAHGLLFEESLVRMNEAERKNVRNAFIALLVVGFIPVWIYTGGALYFEGAISWQNFTISLLISSVLVVPLLIIGIKALRNGTKTVTKGIIIRKRLLRNNTKWVVLGGENEYMVSEEDYNRYNPGDIVSIEIKGINRWIVFGYTIKHLGNITCAEFYDKS